MSKCQEIYTPNYSKVLLGHILIKSIQISDLVQGIVSTLLKYFSMWLVRISLVPPPTPTSSFPTSHFEDFQTVRPIIGAHCYCCRYIFATPSTTRLSCTISISIVALQISRRIESKVRETRPSTPKQTDAPAFGIVRLDKLTSHDAPTSWLFLI